MIYLCNGRIRSVARFGIWNYVNNHAADSRLEPASIAHSVIVYCQDASRSSGTYEVRPAVTGMPLPLQSQNSELGRHKANDH